MRGPDRVPYWSAVGLIVVPGALTIAFLCARPPSAPPPNETGPRHTRFEHMRHLVRAVATIALPLRSDRCPHVLPHANPPLRTVPPISAAIAPPRPAKPRVGKGCVRTLRSRWSPSI